MYKLSKYTYYIKDEEGNLLVCNLLNNVQYKIAKENKIVIEAIINPKEIKDEFIIHEMERKGLYVDDNINEYEQAKQIYDNAKRKKEDILTVMIKPTISCNLKCIYCWQAENNVGIMSEEVVERVIAFIAIQARKSKKVVIDWFGGEPMISFDIIIRIMQAVEKICKENKIPYVGIMTTNGTLLSDEKIKLLLRYHVFSYQITIDGTRKSHNMSRPAKDDKFDSYEMILKNLRNIRDNVKARYLEMIIRINLSDNVLPYIEEFLYMYKEEFLRDSRFSLLLEEVSNKGGERIESSGIKFVERTNKKKVIDLAKKMKLPLHSFVDFSYASITCELTKNNSYNINYDGMVYMCELLSDKNNVNVYNNKGYIASDGTINTKKDCIEYWTNIMDLPICMDCKLYPLCGGNVCPLTKIRSKKCLNFNHMDIIDVALKTMDENKELLYI